MSWTTTRCHCFLARAKTRAFIKTRMPLHLWVETDCAYSYDNYALGSSSENQMWNFFCEPWINKNVSDQRRRSGKTAPLAALVAVADCLAPYLSARNDCFEVRVDSHRKPIIHVQIHQIACVASPNTELPDDSACLRRRGLRESFCCGWAWYLCEN